MNETEAKTKWCPFARGEDPAGANRFSVNRANSDSCLCIASDCMAWRWSAGREGRDGDCNLIAPTASVFA